MHNDNNEFDIKKSAPRERETPRKYIYRNICGRPEEPWAKEAVSQKYFNNK